MIDLVLASTSKRRKDVLDKAGIYATVERAKVDESFDPTWPPEKIALEIAERKAKYVFDIHPDKVVLGVFTVVVVDGEVLHKPVDSEDAARMLRTLSGKNHQVISGCYLMSKNLTRTFISETDVDFGDVTDEEIEYYINTGEVFEKIGAYSIRGFGSRYIKSVQGDAHNLLGIPLYQLCRELVAFEQ